MEIGDLNGDGRNDLVAAGTLVTLIPGNGDGTFGAPRTTAGDPKEFELADVTGDGRLDVVGVVSNQVWVVRQRADGTLADPVFYATDLQFVWGIAAGDVTGDGRADVALSAHGPMPTSVVQVLPQTITGTLGPATRYTSNSLPQPIEAADMNGDGRSDLVTLHGGWHSAGVYVQQTDGRLRQEALYFVPSSNHYTAHALALGDIDSDGMPDVVSADYDSGLVVLRSRQSGPTWGLNNFGQLGDGRTEDSATPVEPVDVGPVRNVAAGGYHSLATRADGTVAASGLNQVGQLGAGSTSQMVTPVGAAGLTGVTSVAAGTFHSLAVRNDGTAWSWGWNYFGQLGSGSTADSSTPAQVPGLSHVAALAGGAAHSLALTGDGHVWVWGLNHAGQLGVPAGVLSTRPVRVPGLTGVVGVAAGAHHSVALKGDGTVWAWGWNVFGQLGQGSSVDSPTPVQVHGLTDVVAVAAGYYHNLALRADGTVWSWGLNHVGQLGTGSSSLTAAVPVQVTGLPVSNPITTIGAGAYHSLVAIRAARPQAVWAWGWNAYGQLGDGSTVDRKAPIRVSTLQVSELSGGIAHSMAASATPPASDVAAGGP